MGLFGVFGNTVFLGGTADESAGFPDCRITISVAGDPVVARAQTEPECRNRALDAFQRFREPLTLQSVRATVTAFGVNDFVFVGDYIDLTANNRLFAGVDGQERQTRHLRFRRRRVRKPDSFELVSSVGNASEPLKSGGAGASSRRRPRSPPRSER